jgi:hypothetical protein
MFSKSKSKHGNNPWGDSSPEKFKDSNDNLLDYKQQLKGLVNPGNMLDMVFGNNKGSGETQHTSPEKKQVKRANETLVFSRSMRESEATLNKETSIILNQLKEQVTILEKSEKAFSAEIRKIKVEQVPAKAGIYYLRYFEWLISIVRQLRMRVEEGKAWLQTFNTRKSKKQGFWQKYKKHGTSFGLSQERTLATQSG